MTRVRDYGQSRVVVDVGHARHNAQMNSISRPTAAYRIIARANLLTRARREAATEDDARALWREWCACLGLDLGEGLDADREEADRDEAARRKLQRLKEGLAAA